MKESSKESKDRKNAPAAVAVSARAGAYAREGDADDAMSLLLCPSGLCGLGTSRLVRVSGPSVQGVEDLVHGESAGGGEADELAAADVVVGVAEGAVLLFEGVAEDGGVVVAEFLVESDEGFADVVAGKPFRPQGLLDFQAAPM